MLRLHRYPQYYSHQADEVCDALTGCKETYMDPARILQVQKIDVVRRFQVS